MKWPAICRPLFVYACSFHISLQTINFVVLKRFIIFIPLSLLYFFSASQSINSYNIVGGGPFCQGTTGSKIWLDDSDPGIVYELVFNDTLTVINNLPGTGDSVYFGRYAVNGFYTVVAHDTILHLNDTMNGQVQISMVLRPQAFSISGGGAICQGGNGVNLFLSGSQSSILYDLFLNDTILMSSFSGNGNSLFLGNYDLDGTYTVIGRNSTLPNCPNLMNGNAVIHVFQPPVQQTLQGNGVFCQGEQGARLFIFPSENDVIYTLYNSSNSSVGVGNGNGDTLFFNPLSQNSTYTSTASRAGVSGCSTNMIGSIAVSPLNQTIYTVSGGGIVCEGSNNGSVILSGSQLGFSYYWTNADQDSSSVPLAGNGGALVFDSLELNGIYNVWSLYTNQPNCLRSMAGTAQITVQPLPQIFGLTGGGYYCEGQEGVEIGLDGSELGVLYELYLNQTLPTNLDSIGTGDSIVFGMASLTGTYSVQASINGCEVDFPSTVDVSITDCTSISNLPNTSSLLYSYVSEGQLILSNEVEYLDIYDVFGKNVFSGKHVQAMDVTTFSSGVFILLIDRNIPLKTIFP